MATIQIQLEDDVLEQAKRLARERACSVSELVSQLIHERKHDTNGASPLGLFADEPALMDQVVAEAMEARQRDPWNRRHG